MNLGADGAGPTAARIDCRALQKIYRMGDTEVRALDGVTTAIEAGEYVAVMGPSGSGKSTFMNLLGALDKPTGGEIRVGADRLAEMSSSALARFRNRMIGFVFQQFNLLARTTALDNVRLPLLYARPPPSDIDQRCRRALDRVGLGDRLHHEPSKLSGGQQQRVAIARALVNDPAMILADEPTGALDSRTSEDILGIFREINESGITVILVTHDAGVAGHARRLMRFHDGHLVEDSR